MKCPECQFENRDGAKFCNECGHKFKLICEECNASNRVGSKFCDECGHNLAGKHARPPKELSFDEKLDKIQRYLPKGITEKILSQRGKIEGERKLVTVMFCDLEGFTPLVERIGAEAAYNIMDQVYELLIHKVHDYEGTINEMTGDGIMALFGAPIALEDAPQRAIRSAYAISKEMAIFSDKVREDMKSMPPLKMRIGIHSGPVVVGTLGNNLRVEFKAVGDTVNIASRMEGLAEPGSIYVSGDTYRLTEGLFRFEALGEKRVKGKKTIVTVHRVIAPSTRKTRFDVNAERGLTRFVGRQKELDLLIDGFERSKKGFGQAFSIISEAGAGKSRLLYEFRKALANEDVTFLEGKCLSYSKSIAYHPYVDILKSNFDIQEGEDDLTVRDKMKRGLQTLSLKDKSTLPYLLELLSVKDSGIDNLKIHPEARKDRIFESIRRIVLKGSEFRPLIVAIEDLHWSDSSSKEVSKFLLEAIPGAKVVLIFTYRPEDFVTEWSSKTYHNQMTLNRLSSEEIIEMANYLFRDIDIENELKTLILGKTEGLPFFIEEFIKSLLNLKIIERQGNAYRLARGIDELVIPSTIQDVIMARVDLLPTKAKELLQTGSAIEREFSYDLIKKVAGSSQDQLVSQLSVLKSSELLYERGVYPESTYIFKHALTREVVYESILTGRKKNLHNKIGRAVEELYKDNIEEQYGVLTEHFIEAENFEKGANYSKLAGKKSEKAASFTDAINYAEKGIFCLEKSPNSKNAQKQLIDTRTALGLYFIQVDYPVKAKEAIDPIIETALKLKYKRRLPQIYTILGQYEAQVAEDLSKAFEYFSKALKITKETGDFVTWVLACWCTGITHFTNCEFEKAAHYFEQALEINIAADVLWGISAMKTYLSWVYLYQGDIPKCYQTISEAVRIAEESGDVYSKATAYPVLGQYYYFQGNFDKAEKYLLMAIKYSERIGFWVFYQVAHHWLGEVYYQIGKYERSKTSFNKTIWSVKNIQFGESYLGWSQISLAKTRIMNNENDIDLEAQYIYANNTKTKMYEAYVKKQIAEMLVYSKDQLLSEAEDWLNASIETNKQTGVKWQLAMDYALYAELYKRKENQNLAKEYLEKSIDIFKLCNADGWTEKYINELAELS